jgi:hypothetical protein
MRTHIHLLTIMVVSGLMLVLVPAGSRSADAASKDDVKKVRGFLDQIVAVVNGDRATVENNVSLLNDINTKVNEVVEKLDTKDAGAVEDAITAATDYRDAILKTEASARELGLAVKKADGVFDLDLQREADGTLPKGTLTVADKDAVKLAKIAFGDAEQATAQARKEVLQENKDLVDKGVGVSDVPPPGAGSPAGLVVVGGYLPQGEVESSASGFAIIRNYDGKEHSGVLSFTVVKGDATASIDGGGKVKVPGGGVRKVDFTITINKPGEVLYKPDFHQTD